MKDRRNKHQIMFDILNILQKEGENINISKLVLKSNLTHQRIKKYIREMVDKQYLKIIKNNPQITDKGYKFVNEFKKVRDIIDAFEI